MKRYELISEIEARTIEEGSTVSLVPGGLITPLAKDTLTARGVKVVRDGQLDETDASLAPVSEIRRVAVGSDHTGIALRQIVVRHLRAKALAVDDQGTDSTASVDYPDIAGRVAFAVAMGEADAGIVIDGAGLGSAIAANKVDGVRAAMCVNETLARYAREHNGANVLALGATLVEPELALAIVDRFLATAMREPRYIRRLSKIRRLELGEMPRR
jgi:ribose 5-phosphate isomerase B